MKLFELLASTQNGAALKSLGSQFGLDEKQTMTAVAQLLPALMQGLSNNTRQPGGMESLMAALARGRHQRYLDDPESLRAPETVLDGNAILGHILGSKEVSRSVAAKASAQTGLGEGVLKQMLPLVAAMAMGALSKQAAQGQAQVVGQGAGGAFQLLAPLLDQNQDGKLDAMDMLGMVGKLFGGKR